MTLCSVISLVNIISPFCGYNRWKTCKRERTTLYWTSSLLLRKYWHFLFLQILSFLCLHPRGHLRGEHTVSPNPSVVGCPTYPSGQYYPEDYETDDENLCTLGFADFLVYNLMILFPSNPLTSMSTRLWILCGSIVSIQIGNAGTIALEKLWKQNSMPALPFPVATFSAYTLFINTIMQQ